MQAQRGGLVDGLEEGEAIEASGLAAEPPAEFLGVGCAGAGGGQQADELPRPARPRPGPDGGGGLQKIATT